MQPGTVADAIASSLICGPSVMPAAAQEPTQVIYTRPPTPSPRRTGGDNEVCDRGFVLGPCMPRPALVLQSAGAHAGPTSPREPSGIYVQADL